MEKSETFVEKLSSILVKFKFISQEEAKALQKAFKDSAKEIFDDFLLEEGLIEEADLLKALGDYYKVPAFDVVGYFFETFLLKKFPKGFLLRNAFVPLEVDENIMVVIASEPDTPELLEKIGKHVSYGIRFRVGLRRDICDTVKEFYDKAVTEVRKDIDLRVERIDERDSQKKGLKEEEEGDSRFITEEEWD